VLNVFVLSPSPQVTVLRDRIKSVDVFMLAFKQQDNRMSPALKSTIKCQPYKTFFSSLTSVDYKLQCLFL